MEDLGHIDINIREMGGGGGRGLAGGGNGVAGGGPGALANQALAASAPMPAWQQQQSMQLAAMRQNIRGFTLTASQVGKGRLPMFGESIGELRDFFSRPTIAGMRSLASNSSATGAMLGKLSASAPKMALFALNMIAVVGGIAVFVRALKSASDMIRERIGDLAQYSSKLALGKAREQIAQLYRDLAEVRANATTYARAQKLDTIASNEWAKAQTSINRQLAYAGMLFSVLKIAAAFKVRYALKPLEATGNYKVADYAITSEALRMNYGERLARMFPVVGQQGNMLWLAINNWLDKLVKNTDAIKDNTAGKDDLAGEINDWFKADVQVMTGRSY